MPRRPSMRWRKQPQGTPGMHPGALDVLAQQSLGMGLRGGVRCGCAPCRDSGVPRPIAGAGPRDFRRCAALRRHWRAMRLPPMSVSRGIVQAGRARGALRECPYRPAIPHECGHHRRGHDGEGAARTSRSRRPAGGARRGAFWARSRNISARRSRPVTPFSLPAKVPDLFHGARTRGCRHRLAGLRRGKPDPRFRSYAGGKFPAL